MERTLSAPGKLFLSGEYAVLWGGVARIAAVGPRTAAFARGRVDREVALALEDGKLDGQTTPLGVRWAEEVPERFHFAARAVDLVLRAVGRQLPGFGIALEPTPAAAGGRKLGLGGSARAVVLATEAARFVLDAPLDTLKLSLLAHTLAQGGKGSGGDVAAIFAGGVVRYRRYDLTTLSRAANGGDLAGALRNAPPVELSRLPDCRLPLIYAFAGQSASTRTLIGEVESRWTDADRQRFVTRSDSLGEQLETGLSKGDFAAVAEASAGLQELLASLGPLQTESMSRLLSLASAVGCAGKMSGAGGGDGCVLFAPDRPTAAVLLESLRSRDILAFELTVEPGLRGESGTRGLDQWLGG
jgi:phosphomevalonate kinase